MTPASISCNLVVIRSVDLERTVAFYRALGLTLRPHTHGKGPMHYAYEDNGHTFEIYPLSDENSPTHSTRIGFAVPCVDDAFQTALAAGAKPLVSPKQSQWGRRAVIVDPDGHRVELTCSLKPHN